MKTNVIERIADPVACPLANSRPIAIESMQLLPRIDSELDFFE